MYGTTFLTLKGEILSAKTLESKTLKFTKFGVGSGDIADTNSIKLLNNLVNPVLFFDISKISRENETQVSVKGIFRNTDVNESFYLKEIGLYALDPDTQQEILFAYVNYGDKAEYVNTSENERVERYYNMIISVDNADNVSLKINSTITYATEQDLNAELLYTYNITLILDNWTLNETTHYYEYNITNNNITSDTKVDLYPNLLNQRKLKDGEVNSYNGGFKICTTEMPEENIDLAVYYQLSHSMGGSE